jgi:hypothetical protein
MEAAIHAASHPLYRERYQHTKRRLGRQRGAKVAQIDLARKPTEAIWRHAHPQPTLRSGRRHLSSGCLTAHLELRHRSVSNDTWSSKLDEAIER